jgi:acyl carrier protein
MLDIPSQDISSRVETIARDFAKGGTPGARIDPDRSLEELGLTSMDMVNLMLAVEAEFDLTIPGSKLIPANFRSIERIAALVAELTR